MYTCQLGFVNRVSQKKKAVAIVNSFYVVLCPKLQQILPKSEEKYNPNFVDY